MRGSYTICQHTITDKDGAETDVSNKIICKKYCQCKIINRESGTDRSAIFVEQSKTHRDIGYV